MFGIVVKIPSGMPISYTEIPGLRVLAPHRFLLSSNVYLVIAAIVGSLSLNMGPTLFWAPGLQPGSTLTVEDIWK